MVELTDFTSAQPDDSFDAGDEVQVESRKRKSKRRDLQEDQYTKQVMSTQDGRAWMHSILALAHLFHESQTERDEGERRLGLKILARINRACPELYVQMLADRIKTEQ